MVSLIKSMMLLEKSIAWPRNRYIGNGANLLI